MNYADLLRCYIKKSRLTLDEISLKLRQQGIAATKPYLSKLQNGKTPPASDKLNQALAEITDGDAKKLQWASFVEKAPEDVKRFFTLVENPLMFSLLKVEEKFPGFLEGKYKGSNLTKEIMYSEEFKQFYDLFGAFIEGIEKENQNPISKEEYEEIYKEEPPLEKGKVIQINLYEAYLDHAKKTINKTPDQLLDDVTFFNVCTEAFHALELRLDQIIANSIIRNGAEPEWATEYIEGLSLREKLESDLKIHLGYDITAESFYTDLVNIIKLRKQPANPLAKTEKKTAENIINIIENAIKAINLKVNENGFE
ncbi:hypothetical protein ACTNDN_11440 [Niallia sp. HCP3S3_B10]|uniref:hypothetical protein n=1 Tax=Niallia sp. HCP3S3_B10 TaxID=3438944 RepID=UPI003F898623